MIQLTHQPLVPDEITAKVTNERNGGVVTFLGNTRRYSEGRVVLYLEYEAYQEMALRKLEEVRRETMARWGVEDVAISHRLGRLEIGETSLVVAVGFPHRREAFAACLYAVDRVKQVVPIWKKEVFQDGYHWVACEEHQAHAAAEETAPRPSSTA